MAAGLIGKIAKQALKKPSKKKPPNKKTRTAKNKRKNLVKDMKAEDRQFSGSPNLPKPSTQSKKKRSRAKAKAVYNKKQAKEDKKYSNPKEDIYF
ncbi:MAG TPA: hypothetical protein EYP94_03740 [Gammaproteobacteria bacterium]|jgi:hypothetical protein|nr:hypothetical protein [Gammaproteobacteria bacterium]